MELAETKGFKSIESVSVDLRLENSRSWKSISVIISVISQLVSLLWSWGQMVPDL